MSGIEDSIRTSALEDGLPPALVELLLLLCQESGADEEKVRAVFAAVEPGARLETVPQAWLMWAWEHGDGLLLTPLRDHMGSSGYGAVAHSVIALHRRVLAGDPVELSEWRRVRTASAGNYPRSHPIHIVLSAAWDFRKAPGTVADVLDAWRDALVSQRFNEIGHDTHASDAMWSNINARQTVYFESVLGPAPKEGDESELAQAWWQDTGLLSEKFFANYKDPIYLRWQGAREKFEADKQTLATVGLKALVRLITGADVKRTQL